MMMQSRIKQHQFNNLCRRKKRQIERDRHIKSNSIMHLHTLGARVHNFRRIKKYLWTESLLTLVHDLVTSRPVYCNFVPCIASGPDCRIDIGPKFSTITPALYFRIAAFQQ